MSKSHYSVLVISAVYAAPPPPCFYCALCWRYNVRAQTTKNHLLLHTWQSSTYSTCLWGTTQTSNRYSTVSHSQRCNAICWGFFKKKAALRWDFQRLDVSVPAVTELMMMYSSSRQTPACDVSACRYAFGCLQSSLRGPGTSGALCSTNSRLHTVSSYHQGRPFRQNRLLYCISYIPRALEGMSLFVWNT